MYSDIRDAHSNDIFTGAGTRNSSIDDLVLFFTRPTILMPADRNFETRTYPFENECKLTVFVYMLFNIE